MKAKIIILTAMFVISMVLSTGLQAWSFDDDSALDVMPDFLEPDSQAEPLDINSEWDVAENTPSKFSVGLKVAHHMFWGHGLFVQGEKFGMPNLSASDLAGPGFELDFDFDWRSSLVFSATAGGYQGTNTEYNIDLYAVYVLGALKIVRQTKYVDYYTGFGFGIYYCSLEANERISTQQPAIHILVGLRIPISTSWSILLEDRIAFSQRANDGFKGMNLGGNFGLFGVSYHF